MLVQVNVYLGSHGSYAKYKENKNKTCVISALPISPKSKWDMVDHLVIKGFKVNNYFYYKNVLLLVHYLKKNLCIV